MGKKNRRKRRSTSQEAASERSSFSSPRSSEPASGNNNSNNKSNPKKKRQKNAPKAQQAAVTVSTQRGTSEANNTTNAFHDKLQTFLTDTLTADERRHFFSNAHVPPERRAELWAHQAEIGQEWINRYAWAVPNDDCWAILKHFGPLVEIGCGANAYWCRQMTGRGIDVIGYDQCVQQGGRIDDKKKEQQKKHKDSHDESGEDFVVQQGGPEVLTKHPDRTLFLCYPDENDHTDDDENGGEAPNAQPSGKANNTDEENDEDGEPMSLAQACLQHYTGQYLIHVGELYGDTLSVPQAPWGRSSSPMFQQQLAADFHCVLRLPLQPGWLHVRDTLTVWKRSELCTLVFASSDDEGDNDKEEDDDGDDEEVQYRYIPPEEQLPQSFAAPYLAHLLTQETRHGEN
mmetsp:Transcript_10233/g.28201  ORF Transcript_10233/g.28201 Transcript_10233/m.28201 type:complete len:401 (+) Transcript_10233:238-1440(+)|eukprot:CAMPEP_0168726946 /NCGR_PEP_ID=MMETSP0724-20121128/4928_1 /TAXON_ID=265536 /ORGANISM="Amphiprora sp., Strain CCMP467" /LENGTH=400 /DNA_ID=CAMNT_0008773771 /DNA_START=181 /DNA_END=1383 /DNA_ORIENTATION=+